MAEPAGDDLLEDVATGRQWQREALEQVLADRAMHRQPDKWPHHLTRMLEARDWVGIEDSGRVYIVESIEEDDGVVLVVLKLTKWQVKTKPKPPGVACPSSDEWQAMAQAQCPPGLRPYRVIVTMEDSEELPPFLAATVWDGDTLVTQGTYKLGTSRARQEWARHDYAHLLDAFLGYLAYWVERHYQHQPSQEVCTDAR